LPASDQLPDLEGPAGRGSEVVLFRVPSQPQRMDNASEPAAQPRLDSWKEIAAYFRRNERTVRRWEQTEGLPVHRHLHEKRGTVHAYTAELDAWRANREDGLEKQASPVADRKDRRLVWSAALVAVLATAGVVTWRIAGRGRTTHGPVQVKPLTSYPGSERYPSFSPDGNQVAFSWDGGRQDNIDIYVKTIGVEAPRRITSDPAEELSPAWSPDGRWIAFIRVVPEGMAAVCLIPVAGGEERKLAEVRNPPRPTVFGSYIAWSPSGEWLIVPDRDSPRESFGLARIAVANGEKRRLTSPRFQHADSGAAVSPNGRTVAFIRRTAFEASEIYVMAVSDHGAPRGAEQRVTSFGRLTTSPAWTPDGRELLFLSAARLSETGLWRMAGSGAGRPEFVASLGDGAAHLAFSRQRRLAFTRHMADTNIWRIRAVYPAGNGAQREVAPLISSTRKDRNGQYSPDGKHISFESNRSGSVEIWRCERDGSNAVALTSLGGPDLCCSRWSPDGRRLVFVSYREGRATLYLVNTSGGAPQRLTNGLYNHNTPSWSRDGRWVYFQSDRSGRFQIWKMPASGGEAVQVTQGGGQGALESIDGRYVYYTKGGTLASDSASLWRTSGPGGEETQILDGLAVFNSFAVVEEGIYFLLLRAAGGAGGSIEFFDFATGKSEMIAAVNRPFRGGLSVLPGARGQFSEILYTQVDYEGDDLMMAEYSR
jgi:Tol biopolymer transport system component